MNEIISVLQTSNEPSIRYRLAVDIFDKPQDSPDLIKLREEIKRSLRVEKMLEGRTSDGRFPWHAYNKWKGAFWTLLILADLGYPGGTGELVPLRDQVLEWLLDRDRLNRVPLINGRYRRCALQEASAVYTMLAFDMVDPRIEQLMELLLKWQWPDGGWNCDKNPLASHSSFYESWIPLRAFHAYAKYSSDPRVQTAIDRASEVFLSRKLFKRRSDDAIMYKGFTQLAFPPYWHYDILAGLIVMHEIGKLPDPRCSEAIDLLESKRLLDGGFAAETSYYKITDKELSGVSPVKWGPISKIKMNEFVTVRALSILKKAGRFNLG